MKLGIQYDKVITLIYEEGNLNCRSTFFCTIGKRSKLYKGFLKEDKYNRKTRSMWGNLGK